MSMTTRTSASQRPKSLHRASHRPGPSPADLPTQGFTSLLMPTSQAFPAPGRPLPAPADFPRLPEPSPFIPYRRPQPALLNTPRFLSTSPAVSSQVVPAPFGPYRQPQPAQPTASCFLPARPLSTPLVSNATPRCPHTDYPSQRRLPPPAPTARLASPFFPCRQPGPSRFFAPVPLRPQPTTQPRPAPHSAILPVPYDHPDLRTSSPPIPTPSTLLERH